MNTAVSSVRLDHLGLPATIAQEIGFVDSLDSLVDVDPRQTLSFGQSVLAMVLNALGFTSKPLYMSPEFFRRRDLKFLLGASKSQPDLMLEPDHLNEHKLGRALDTIAQLGPDRVFLAVAVPAFRKFKIKTTQVHHDTTTHSFHGLYEGEDGNPLGADFAALDPNKDDGIVEVFLTQGFSKDFRLHCKQIVHELVVSGDGDVPLLFRAHSGNESDVTVMRERLENLKRCLTAVQAEDLMPKILVADCKLYTQESIEIAQREGTTWVTRVPDTVKETAECIEMALRGRGHWKKLSTDQRISFQEFSVEKWGLAQSYFVVRTEGSKSRIEKAIPKRLKKDVSTVEAKLRALRRQRFACVPDLEAALRNVFSESRYLTLTRFEHESRFTKKGPGRPAKDAHPSEAFSLTTVDYVEDKDRMRAEELRDSCFVLGTNADAEQLSSEEVLQAYLKDQQGVERGFRFLKDPQYFCDAFFLKNPARVVALLCVMTLGLLLHALLQRKLRLDLNAQKETIPNQKKKPTQSPTMRWVNQKFEGVDVIKVREADKIWFQFEKLEPFVQKVLKILGPPYVERYSPAYLS